MALGQNHELHSRRWGRNVGVAVALACFVALIFGMTIAKVSRGDQMEAFDHQPRASVTPEAQP